ncbi:MAG: tRNA (N(6)-L-threonylcarbamoyladenosine(37)-C(2))-methylthiotransferase, partial [Candidatus Micrarchaeota archaeon]
IKYTPIKNLFSNSFLMQKVVFKTFGCSNNFSESEVMAGILEEKGYSAEESSDFSSAEIVVFNMCSVKGPSVNLCLNLIRKLKQSNPGKKIVVAGCVPKTLIPEIHSINKNISILNTHHIEKINQVIGSSFENNPQEFSFYNPKVKLGFPKKRINPFVSIVPILSGCNDHCSYCSTVLIKGPTFSFPQEKILNEVEKSVLEGCKEVWITSQDNGAYLTEKGKTQLPQLIKKICRIKGDFFIRIGMTNPNYILQCLPELIKVMKNKKVFKFLHIPVQSGNNEVLKKMKRRYTVEEYKKIIKTLKKEIPEITIATDVIVGFPTETKKQFLDSFNLIKETKPEVLNISRFQSRPATLASTMKQLKGEEIKERSRKLTKLFYRISLENNKKWIGKKCKVLIDEKGKRKNQSIGRNSSYKQIVFEKKIPLGKKVKAKIIGAERFHLVGKLLE